jgi:hypothetical protein
MTWNGKVLEACSFWYIYSGGKGAKAVCLMNIADQSDCISGPQPITGPAAFMHQVCLLNWKLASNVWSSFPLNQLYILTYLHNCLLTYSQHRILATLHTRNIAYSQYHILAVSHTCNIVYLQNRIFAI